MKDHRSNVVNLDSWESKPQKKKKKNSGLNGVRTHDFCNSGAALLSTELSRQLVTCKLRQVKRTRGKFQKILWVVLISRFLDLRISGKPERKVRAVVMDVCFWGLKERNKSRRDSYRVRNASFRIVACPFYRQASWNSYVLEDKLIFAQHFPFCHAINESFSRKTNLFASHAPDALLQREKISCLITRNGHRLEFLKKI